MKKQNGFNALVYMFDHAIADRLGYSYDTYMNVLDTMSEYDSVFVMESVFEMLVIEDAREEVSQQALSDFNEAIHMFNEHAEFLKKSEE